MPERRRLLVALVVHGAVAAEINGLRRALGSREIERIPPHLTLVPPINLPATAGATVETHLREVAAQFSALELELGPPARFSPHPVLYLAVQAQPPNLQLLAERLAAGPFEPPATREARRFVPHVTLISGGAEELVRDGEALLAAYRATVCIEQLTLLEQEVGTAGHPWHTVGEFRLGRPALRGRGGRELEFHLSPHFPADLPAELTASVTGSAGAAEEPLIVMVTEAGSPVATARALVGRTALFVASLDVLAHQRGLGIGGQLVAFLERLGAERGLGDLAFLDARSPEFLLRHGYHPSPLGLYVRGGISSGGIG